MHGLRICVLLALVLAVAWDAGCERGDSGRPSSPMRGLLTGLRTSESGELTSFTLKADDGRTWEFEFAPKEPGAVVPVAHLQAHIDERLPVSVTFYSSGPKSVAYRIDDG